MKRSTSLFLVFISPAGIAALLALLSLSAQSEPPALQAPSAQADPLARFILLEEGDCPVLPDMCNCKNFRRQGKRCLLEVIYESDGTAVPRGRLYAATLDCGECRNLDPPAPAEKTGAVILRGPHHPDVQSALRQPYDDLIFWTKKFRRDFGTGVNPNLADAAAAEQLLAKYKRQIADILVKRCVGYFYNAVPDGQRIPVELFTYSMQAASADGAAMETDVQFAGAQLIVYSQCFFDNQTLQPTPEVFCAGLLHEIYHWQQERYGGGESDLQRYIYELACTEKMRLNSFYVWMLGVDRSDKEFSAVQRDYWLPRFEKEWARLDRAGRKKLAGWAWSRGGVNDSTAEDALMRNLMYLRSGWMYDFWETLFQATELKIIRMPLHPLYKNAP